MEGEADGPTTDPSRSPRVGVGTYQPPTDQLYRLLGQLGVTDVLLIAHDYEGIDSALPLYEAWSVDYLASHRRRVEDAGLRLHAIETLPIPLYDVLLGLDDYDRQIDVITTAIRNAGEVGIPIIGYSAHPPGGAVRTTREYEVRGGALASAFDMDAFDPSVVPHEGSPPREVLWDRYEQFLNDVVPVAEEAGVTLALHPSDPPVEELAGIPLLFHSFESFRRAMAMVPSERHQLKFCLGCWSEMGEDLTEVIRYFGGEQIAYVHFRDVVGTVPRFHETFLDDDASNFDAYEVLQVLFEEGFTGVVTPDHVPQVEGDPGWEFGGVLGRAFTVGYLKGLIEAVK